MPDARVIGNRQERVTDQHQRQPAGRLAQIALKEIEQLVAPFVPVDSADVHGERAADVVQLPEPVRLGIGRHIGSHADHHAGDRLVRGDGVNHGALFGRVVHDGPHRAEQRRKDR